MSNRIRFTLLVAVLAAFTTAALAQGTSRVETALVLDFENKSGMMGEQLSRLATDAVAVELANSARFEVLRREEINRQIRELGLRSPLDSVGRRKLAQALGATVIVDGAIEFVKDDVKAKPRTVSVGLTVRVTEVSSGELIAGAAQVGVAKAGPGVSDVHTLVTEAVGKVGETAPRLAFSQSTPDGIVMNSDSYGRARARMINRGARHGVKKGMKFMVLRDGYRIGTAEALNVFPHHSEIRVLEGDNLIKSEDRIRAIGQIVGKLK